MHIHNIYYNIAILYSNSKTKIVRIFHGACANCQRVDGKNSCEKNLTITGLHIFLSKIVKTNYICLIIISIRFIIYFMFYLVLLSYYE